MQLARLLCQVWATVLDEQLPYLFFDEPVPRIDINHQLITMNITYDFARRSGDVVAIQNDLNLTAMYGTRSALCIAVSLRPHGRRKPCSSTI